LTATANTFTQSEITDANATLPPVAFDAKAFRVALGFFPTGVAIMTTVDEHGQPIGLTCNSFSSVSLDPPLVLWSIRIQSRLVEVFRTSRRFAINVLSDAQKDLSTRFASSSISNKFEGVSFSNGILGVPLIEFSSARFECLLFAEHVIGDHVVFIGQVERFDQVGTSEALVFHRGAYVALSRSLRDLALSGRLTEPMLRDAAILIYGELARLAATNGSDEDFDAMQACVRSMEHLHLEGRVQDRYQAAQEFFRHLGASAHNEVLGAVAESLTTIMGHLLLSEANRYKPELVKARREIVVALRERSPETSSRLVKEYFDIRLPS
jgi:flavin reductase (DIM6/NTAB) family NADH-FMN oxidoreductase RutF